MLPIRKPTLRVAWYMSTNQASEQTRSNWNNRSIVTFIYLDTFLECNLFFLWVNYVYVTFYVVLLISTKKEIIPKSVRLSSETKNIKFDISVSCK